jgi:hypothetical protein
MAQPPDPSKDRKQPPAASPVMLTILCAVLVAIATWTIFLIR